MVLVVNDLDVEVRDATIADVPVLMSFIRSMAAFEKLPLSATEDSLRAALFGDAPAARTLLAFVDGQAVAYVIYFFSFSTMLGRRGLWLEDLFIDPAFRGKGIGHALMACLADIAIQHECGRFEWTVLDWNDKAIGFYQRLGAQILDDWRIGRLEASQLPAVARQMTRRRT